MVRQGIFILIILSAISCGTIKSIHYEPFILTLQLNKDTTAIGDSLYLILKFKNVSQSPVVFYPNAFIFLMHSSSGGLQEYKLLNEDVDTLNSVILPVNESTIKHFTVAAEAPFFKLNRINSIEVMYSFDMARNKGYRKKLKQKGYINYWYSAKSDSAIIYVKN
jgi:hypothetical protein